MNQDEMVTLIRAGVPSTPGIWADIGAGSGNFTWALSELLAPGSHIYAIDRDGKAMNQQRARLSVATPRVPIEPIQADFTLRLKLPLLDGVLMANALHFIRDQEAVLKHILSYVRPHGTFLMVEYEVETPLRYVPFPVPLVRLQALAAACGLSDPASVGLRRSPSSGIVLYAAVAHKRPSDSPQ